MGSGRRPTWIRRHLWRIDCDPGELRCRHVDETHYDLLPPPVRFPDATRYSALRIRLVRDDGAIVYLNGQEVARSAFPEGDAPVGASTFAVGVSGSAEGIPLIFGIPATLLVDGENVFAVEVHQASNNSSDLGFSLELEGDVLAAGSGMIEVQDDTFVRTRILAGDEWSALGEALFVTGDRAADLLCFQRSCITPLPAEQSFWRSPTVAPTPTPWLISQSPAESSSTSQARLRFNSPGGKSVAGSRCRTIR